MQHETSPGQEARLIRVRGIVQGVGFRPFIFRIAQRHRLSGWVLNDGHGVEIHAEGQPAALEAFISDLRAEAPAPARVRAIEVRPAFPGGHDVFTIRPSAAPGQPTVQVSPDLAVCQECLAELHAGDGRRRGYPYINCTNCGPRYSILLGLPYDRALTTMNGWEMCGACAREYDEPGDRSFHAQPNACWRCGPDVLLERSRLPPARGTAAVAGAARLLADGGIVAIKGLGGYHLACDASSAAAVSRLRERKFRKEKPFALMVRDLGVARRVVALGPEAEEILIAPARPIVLAPARIALDAVAPDTGEFGVMLPYTPVHHLLFAAGAPEVLVMTSGNASSEPIAYEDTDARERLVDLADALLTGERPIARRVEDSVVRTGTFGPVVLRRSRGYAPAALARLPATGPVLAAGADLKNTVTLVVDGEAIVSQHIGDLEHYAARQAFDATIRDLLTMWNIRADEVTVIHDAHPQYASTQMAQALPAAAVHAVQHHRAHIASVLAERDALDRRVVGVALDGTGYGDDGTIWGGELFVGSLAEGLTRVAHLLPAPLPGGDAAARHPVHAAAGFLATLEDAPGLTAPPFNFPPQYARARQLILSNVRVFRTTSAGRLFDAVAALLGFTRPVSFEGQAAAWLEHLARGSRSSDVLPIVFTSGVIDYRRGVESLVARRLRRADTADLARAFHRGLARALASAVVELCETHDTDIVALSGGVWQNELLLGELNALLASTRLHIWTNQKVPPGDGGISLGQAALWIATSGALAHRWSPSENC